MGANIARRLMRDGHRVVGFNQSPEPTQALAAEGVTPAFALPEMVAQLEPPRTVWIMVPAGEATESVVTELGALMQPGDVIIDGGNTFYKDDIRRAAALKLRGIAYVDVGTSGGGVALRTKAQQGTTPPLVPTSTYAMPRSFRAAARRISSL
jgi:6-phosphogluconate dehydrogenase